MSDSTERPPIGEAEFKAITDRVMLFARLVVDDEFDYDGYFALVNRSEAVGWITDPTAYMRGLGNMRAMRDLVKAYMAFRDEARKARGIFAGAGKEQA